MGGHTTALWVHYYGSQKRFLLSVLGGQLHRGLWVFLVLLDVLVYPDKSQSCDPFPNKSSDEKAVANWTSTSSSTTTRVGKRR